MAIIFMQIEYMYSLTDTEKSLTDENTFHELLILIF